MRFAECIGFDHWLPERGVGEVLARAGLIATAATLEAGRDRVVGAIDRHAQRRACTHSDWPTMPESQHWIRMRVGQGQYRGIHHGDRHFRGHGVPARIAGENDERHRVARRVVATIRFDRELQLAVR